ncbi:MAG: hypothetical protein OXB86_00170, partial [Bdellovibrionales bacterium]|nr:hypothetical protein [Bdellovibrionales bacterium]
NKPLRSIYRQRVLDVFGNDARSLGKDLDRACQSALKKQRQFNKNIPQGGGALSSDVGHEGQQGKKKPSLSSAPAAERILLVLCLDSEEFLKKFISLNGKQLIKTPFIFDIFQDIEKKYGQTAGKFDTLLSSVMDQVSDGHLLLREAHIILKGNREVPEEIFNDCLSFLRKNQSFAEANALVTEIKMTGKGDMKELEQVFHLTKQRLSRRNTDTPE